MHNALTIVKSMLLTPMPSPSASTAAAVNSRSLTSSRAENVKS